MPETMCLSKVIKHHKEKIDDWQMSEEVKQEHIKIHDFLVFLSKQLTKQGEVSEQKRVY